MKKILIILLFLLVLPCAFSESLFNSKAVTVDFEISSSAEIVGDIESATINLTFFPKNSPSQQVIDFQTNGIIKGDVLQFNYKSPKDSLDFGLNARVRSENVIAKVSQKIKFPIENLDRDLEIYTKPSPTIDSGHEKIIETASLIVDGEDDLYGAVFKLADWTKNNINYNLSTLTADVSQKASWVLENKKGVCDELTSLFIAMLRSVGIPAKFVSGIAYTNSELFSENWGPHGWAEVYFPGYGWVPFDVTYGEFGWVDPTHFKFEESVDSDEASTYYQWLGRNANIRAEGLDIKTSLVGAAGEAAEHIGIDVKLYRESVKFGSYNLVEAKIENPNGFYYATDLQLVKPKEVEIIGKNSRSILLLPYEGKSVFWIVKISGDLDERYSYTLPITVTTPNNLSSGTKIISSQHQEHISLDEVQYFSVDDESKKYSGDILIDCSAKKEVYEFERAYLSCLIRNTGNIYLSNAQICKESSCAPISLGISQTKNVTFGIDTTIIGPRSIPITLKSNLLTKTEPVSVIILDRPSVNITEIVYPKSIAYKGNYSISFIVAKTSFSNPEKVEIVLAQNKREKKWSVAQLDQNRKYVIDFLGKNLRYGKNDYKITITYYDKLGNRYETSEEFVINLDDASSIEKAALLFNRLDLLSFNSIIVLIFIVGGAFLFLIMFMFRNRG